MSPACPSPPPRRCTCVSASPGISTLPCRAVTAAPDGIFTCPAGPAGQVKIPSGAAVTALHGNVLMPGLADTHVHLLGGGDGHAGDMLGYRRYTNAGSEERRVGNQAGGGMGAPSE